MGKSAFSWIMISITAFFGVSPEAQAARFSVIATIVGGGGPQIGAVSRDTIIGTVPFDSGDGILFSLTTKGQYSLLHTFNGSTDGAFPNGRLATDSKGDLFGTAQSGGANNAGTLWEYSSRGSFSLLHAFGGSGDGSAPFQGPTLLGTKTIVGTASQGAINNDGNIFSFSNSGEYIALYDFLSGADGHCPFSGVAAGSKGFIYGTTVGLGWGGNPNGGVWSFSTLTGLQTLYVFQNKMDGEWPDQAPVVDNAGNIYGTTHVQNGLNFAGALWTVNASGVFSVMHQFDPAKDGGVPNGPLLLGADGKLYGTTAAGGPDGFGTVYRISPSGTFQVLHSFTGGSDGGVPTGNLVQNSKGLIFGGTTSGTVFEIKP